MIIINIMIKNINLAWNTRHFWWFKATSRTKARFARTTLGSFWLGFSNLLSIATLGIVYGTVFSVADFKDYFIYLGVGLVIWNTISASISSAPDLFSINSENIKNMNIRPIVYTLEEWSFQIQTFFQSFLLVFIVLIFFKQQLVYNLVLYSFFPFLNFLLFLYWVPLIICLVSVRYTDFSQFVPIILQLIFLTSPILYRKENLGGLSWITDYNLIYKILDPLRISIIEGQFNFKFGIITFLINILGIYLSLFVLKKQSNKLPFLV